MDPKLYNYQVFWSEEDQEFVGVCAEFPGMSWLEGDQHQALSGIVALVGECIEDLEAHNEPVPSRRQLACA
jgi:predicted RNase H-like HicB family nuclease